MTNTNRPDLTDTQTERYTELRAKGHPANVAIRAARNMIGASEGRRGPRAPFSDFTR